MATGTQEDLLRRIRLLEKNTGGGVGTDTPPGLSADFVALDGHDDDIGQQVAGPLQITSLRMFPTASEPQGFGGTPLYLKQDLFLSAINGFAGPPYASNYTGPSGGGSGILAAMTGPRGQFNIEGTCEFDISSGTQGAPLPIQVFNVVKNKPATALNIGSGYSIGVDTQYLADGATVGWTPGDYPTLFLTLPGLAPSRSFTGYAEGTYYGTINGGQGNWSNSYHLGFNSLPFFHGNVQFGHVVNYFANELYLESDGTDTPTVDTHFGIYMQPFQVATSRNIQIYLDSTSATADDSSVTTDAWSIYTKSHAFFGDGISTQGTLSLGDWSAIGVGTAILTATVNDIDSSANIHWSTTANMGHTFANVGGTDVWTVAPSGIGMYSAVSLTTTLTNSSSANINLSPVYAFLAAYTKQIDTATGKSMGVDRVFSVAPTYQRANSGTYTTGTSLFGFVFTPTQNASGCALGQMTGFQSNPTNTAGTVSILSHFDVEDVTNGGTVTAQYGFYCNVLAGGTQNIQALLDGSSGSAPGASATWGLYSRATQNYIGGALKLGSLTINGTFAGFDTSANLTATNITGGGSVVLNSVSKTGTYTTSASDTVIQCTSGTFTVTLSSTNTAGQIQIISNSGGGTITAAAGAGKSLNGPTSIATHTAQRYVGDGSGNWAAA